MAVEILSGRFSQAQKQAGESVSLRFGKKLKEIIESGEAKALGWLYSREVIGSVR